MQQTLLKSFTIGGIGMHTAEYASVRVRPAYAGEGRYFVRVPEGTNANLYIHTPQVPLDEEAVREGDDGKSLDAPLLCCCILLRVCRSFAAARPLFNPLKCEPESVGCSFRSHARLLDASLGHCHVADVDYNPFPFLFTDLSCFHLRFLTSEFSKGFEAGAMSTQPITHQP